MVDLVECLTVDVCICDAKCIEYVIDTCVVISGEDGVSGEDILLAGIVEVLRIAVEGSCIFGGLEQLVDRIGVARLCIFIFQSGADGGFVVVLCRVIGVGCKKVVVIVRHEKLCHLRDGRVEVYGMTRPGVDPEVVSKINREGFLIASRYTGQCGVEVFPVVCFADCKVRIFGFFTVLDALYRTL